MKVLRQGTAQNIVIGPFISSTDGYSPVTNLVASALRHDWFLLFKNGAAGVTGSTGTVAVADADAAINYGYYIYSLSATDTNTLGSLRIAVSNPVTLGFLPYWEDYMVIPQENYDMMYGSNGVSDSIKYIESLVVSNSSERAFPSGVTVLGGTTSSTVAAMQSPNNTLYAISNNATQIIDILVDFTLPDGLGIPQSITFAMWLSGVTDTDKANPCYFSIINHDISEYWESLLSSRGYLYAVNNTQRDALKLITIPLKTTNARSSGANQMQIRIQSYCNSTVAAQTLYIDTISVAYTLLTEATQSNIAGIKAKTDLLPTVAPGLNGGLLKSDSASNNLTSCTTVSSVTAKTGYELASAERTAIGTAVWATTTRALTDKINFALSTANITTLVAAVWSYVLTSADALAATTIGKWFRSVLPSAVASVPGSLNGLPTVDANNGVTLKDDAITAAKFDESTAFPLKSVDTGATTIARTGADGNTLKTLSDKLDTIDGIVGSGVPTLYAPTSDTRIIGTATLGTFTSLASHDEGYYVTGEVSGTGLEVEVVRDLTDISKVPSVLRVTGYYDGSATHNVDVSIFNYKTSTWGHAGTMLDRDSMFEYIFPLSVDNHNAATGEMKVKFTHSVGTYSLSHKLYLDWISFEKVETDSKLHTDVAAIYTLLQDVDAEVDKLASTVEADGASVYRFTVNALELAPVTAAAPSAADNAAAVWTAEVREITNDIPTLSEIGTQVWTTEASRVITGGGSVGSLTAADVWTHESRTLTADSGAGTGSISVPYPVVATNGFPLAAALVEVYTEAECINLVAASLTDMLGIAPLKLDAGTYYMWVSKAGYSFPNPDTEIITEA